MYSNQFLFPEVDETAMWCQDDRYTFLLDLGLGMAGVAMSVFILVGSSVASLL